MMLSQFHVTIHAHPQHPLQNKAVEIDGHWIESILCNGNPLGIPLERSFEEAADELNQLPRMFLEPDGSFVWVSSNDSLPWQLDGCLYDRNNRLQYVELKGSCPEDIFRQLLSAIGCPPMRPMFQLVRQAVFLDEHNFHLLSSSSATGTS